MNLASRDKLFNDLTLVIEGKLKKGIGGYIIGKSKIRDNVEELAKAYPDKSKCRGAACSSNGRNKLIIFKS